jgi:phosphoenolpyruvate-protein phosphotransferase
MKQGIPVAPGVAVARAYCIDSVLVRGEPHHLDAAALPAEMSRLDSACAAAAQELDALISRVSQQLGPDEAAIFQAHRLLLRDPVLINKIKSAIRDRQIDARSALQQVNEDYTALFEGIQDVYLKERLTDLRDVISRIQMHLAQPAGAGHLDLNEPVILVAKEILPSHLVMFNRLKVAGILTETGGPTGHGAILARSLGIPAVSDLEGILSEVHTCDSVAVDGREGHVYLNPGPEVEAAYRKLQREYSHLRERLVENRELESITTDGTRVELLANVNGQPDALLAGRVGAGGIGLYRTEYLFLTHASVPNEEEQLAAYQAVLAAAPGRAATIRTLDLGGDKSVPYLGDHREANPFLGWRSIRLVWAHPALFQTQLRAILRAGVHGQVDLLFPMISTLDEIRRLKEMVEQTRVALRLEGVSFAEKIPLGMMIEVPAAALCIEAFLEEVDFVSIGSNDLIQYVMAADRDNPKVAHLCEPFAPAILKLLAFVIQACNKRGTPVTLCGEMAGRLRLVLPLLGMGLRRFSMSPALIPTVKEMIRRTPLAAAEEVCKEVLRMKTVNEVRDYLTVKTRQFWPEVSILDTRA